MNKEIKSNTLEKNQKYCVKCYGYGWWCIGLLSPIGKGDAHEWGKRVIKCPWCGAGFVDEGERWEALVNYKDSQSKQLKGGNEKK